MNNLHPTTAAVGSSASGVIILVWAAHLMGIDLPADVAVALCGVLGGIVGSIMRALAAKGDLPPGIVPPADGAKP